MSHRRCFLFEGEKVRLRPVTEADLPRLYQWDRDDEIAKWAGRQFNSEAEVREWYLGKNKLNRMVFAIESLDSRLIGEIEIINISWRLHTGEMRVFIGDKEYWNQGYGTDAVRTLAKGLLGSTGLQEILLRVDEENSRARRCYHKVGFRIVGKVRVRDEKQRSRNLLLMRVTACEVS